MCITCVIWFPPFRVVLPPCCQGQCRVSTILSSRRILLSHKTILQVSSNTLSMQPQREAKMGVAVRIILFWTLLVYGFANLGEANQGRLFLVYSSCCLSTKTSRFNTYLGALQIHVHVLGFGFGLNSVRLFEAP